MTNDEIRIEQEFDGFFRPKGTIDEPGWLGTPEWEQLPLPPLYIKVAYNDDQDKAN
jgi:hypothetical protein